MFCTYWSDNVPPSSEHGNLRDFLRARRPDLANFRWTLSSYTEKVDVFGNYNVVRCCCVVWWYITSREENRHVSLRDMLSFGWQVCSSPIPKCTLPSDWLEIHCCDDYRLHWAWNFSTVGDAFTGFDFNWICQMVFHNMPLLPFFSLEILPQEMFWLGLRVELRSHRPPNWSDLIYPPWPGFRSLLISSSNILTLLSTQVADFGLARDLTECEYYRKTGDGKVTIMKSMIMATFITLIQSDEWRSIYLLETFFIPQLPVKWMSPESLFQRTANSMSG